MTAKPWDVDMQTWELDRGGWRWRLADFDVDTTPDLDIRSPRKYPYDDCKLARAAARQVMERLGLTEKAKA